MHAVTATVIVAALLLVGTWLLPSSDRRDSLASDASARQDEGRAHSSAPLRATYHVRPGGSDSNPGTRKHPWRTIDRALETLSPGDSLFLGPGTYGARGTVTQVATSGSASRPITFRGYPGEVRPTLLGHFEITGDHVRFSHVVFDGPTGRVKPVAPDNPLGEQVQVAVDGDHVTIDHSIIRDSAWHAGIFLDDAEDVTIRSNCITGHGDEDMLEHQWNLSHGIYWHSGSGVVADNVIRSNLARGVQLYEEPHDVVVEGNAILDNGRAGIQFAAATSDSTAVDNIVAFNGQSGIRTSDLSGSGNVASHNIGYLNADGDFEAAHPGLTLEDNVSLPAEPFLAPKGEAVVTAASAGLPSRYRDRVAELERSC